MDNKTIFTKTAKGVGEAVGKTRALSRELRLVLKEVDGKTSLEELLDKISGLSQAKLHAALNKLSTEDYIREFVAPTFEDDALDFITILPLPTKTERAPGQRTRINEALRVQLEARAQAEVEAYERIEREQDERERRGEEQHARREQGKEAARAAQQQAMKEAQEAARIEAEQRATQKIEEQAQREAEQQARHDAEEAARQAAERQAAAAEEQKRQEAEEQARQAEQAQAQARQAAEEKYRLEAEAKEKQDADEKKRRDAEQRAQQELEDQARRQAEKQARRDAEEQIRVTAQQLVLENAAQQARRDAEEQVRKEAEEAEQAEEQARRSVEETQAEEKKQAEERRRKLAVEHRAKRDAEVRAKRELEQQARRSAEERSRQQAEDESRRAAEERDRQELVQQARRDEEERVRHEAEEKLRREEEQARHELEQQARRAADEEERARQGALEKARRAAEDKVQREAEALADKNAEEEIRREFEELARQQAEAEARKKAEQARRQIEEIAQRKAEAKAIKAEQDRARRESEQAEARREADVRAKQEVEQWMREAAQEKDGPASLQDIQPQREAQHEPDVEEFAAQRIEQDEQEFEGFEKQHEQEPIEAQAEKKSFFREGPKTYRTPIKWRKPAALALSLSIAGSLGLIHVMTFDSKAALFEKAASAQFQQPVKIGKLYLSLLPQPQWRLEDVSIGSDAQITISRINASTGLGSLYRGEADFKSIELQSPVFSEQALEWLLFGQARQAHFKVGRISASNAALASSNISLPRFNAAAAIGANGAWDTITVDSLDKKTRVQLRPGGATVLVELTADSFDMPFGSALRLDELIAKGTARRNELAISSFSGRLYDGILTGTAKLQWGTGWRMQGDVQAKLIDAAQVAPELLENGRLAGSATYVLEAEYADKLFGAPRAEGNFVVQNGTLTGVDFAKFLRSPNSAGTSSFAELTGNFTQANGKTQLQKVYMNAGLLSVTGNADMDQGENLTGRLAVELKSPTQQARSNLVVAGTLAAPQFSR